MDDFVSWTTSREAPELHFCTICSKPFSKEPSWKRHESYCRRTQNKSKVRLPSCRACSAAKTKCTFEAQCQRCKRKSIECVYDRKQTSRSSVAPTSCSFSSSQLIAPIGVETLDDGAVHADPTMGADMENALTFNSFSPIYPTDEFSMEQLVNVDLSEATSTQFIFDTSALMPEVRSWSPRPAHDPIRTCQPKHDSHVDPAMLLRRFQSPKFENFPLPAGLTNWDYYPEIPYLKPLPRTDRVARQYALTVIRVIRGYPQMMLRQDTFPPFIHTCMYGGDASGMTLPRPLANCMSIAQIFASRTEETKPILWHAIAAELQNSIDNVGQFSKFELLAAVQAGLIYIIMRAIDGVREHCSEIIEMLVTSQIVVEHLKKAKNETVCCHIEQQSPSSNWGEWVFAESQRRVTSIWCVLTKLFSIKTFFAHDEKNSYLMAPLPSAKSVWEAKTEEEWARAYASTDMGCIGAFSILNDLAQANQETDDPDNERRMEMWNSGVDNFGMLMNIAAPILVM